MKVILLILRKLFYKKTRFAHLIAFVKYNSFLKLSNLLCNEYERRTRKVNLSSKPYLVNSELTNHCTCRCPFCYTGKKGSRPGGFAMVGLYEKLFWQIGRYTYLITLHGWGEPLMHRRLPEIIRLAHENRIFTVVTTNGNLLTRELSKEIITNRLDYLVVSVDGTSEESYQKYRIGGNFEVVMHNLRELISLKKEMGSSTPFIEWQFIVFKHNEHEMDAATRLSKEIGVDNIVFMPAYTEDAGFDASDNKYHWPQPSSLSKRIDCKHLWTTLTFHWNGNVVPCCNDYDGKISYGDLLRQDLDQIWNNRLFRESREIVNRGTNDATEELPCISCARKLKHAGKNKYSED